MSIQLLHDGVALGATVGLIPGSPYTVELAPETPLEAATDYVLVVSTDVHDLEGDPLPEELRVDFRTADVPPAVTLARVSGDAQPAKAGQELAAPFVVRVTDEHGVGIPNVGVTWSVTSGEGVLDGQWDCPPPNGPFGNPTPTRSALTDAAGYARVSFMPTWFGFSTVVARSAGIPGSPVTFTADATDDGATIEIVSGGEQEGITGPFATPNSFAVRVRDGDGNGVPHVTVHWRRLSGAGIVRGFACATGGLAGGDQFITRTSPADAPIGAGYASVEFEPRAFGFSTVVAGTPGSGGSSLFTVNTTAVSVGLSDNPWYGGPGFIGPGDTDDVTIPAGVAVEFVNFNAAARIVSTSAPAGGAAFDSGDLVQEGRFRFVPDVSGTWEFLDQVSGATGKLTVESANGGGGSGGIVVSNATTGGALDLDGYQLIIRGADQAVRTVELELNTQTSFMNLSPGNATVELEDVAENCSVAGGASRSVAIIEGAEVRLEFPVTCTPPPELGSVRLIVASGGTVVSMNADGSVTRRLTDGMDGGPSVSGDGARIAFVRAMDESYWWGPTAIFLVDANGGALTQLTDAESWARANSWSPDGDRIAVAVGFGGGRIDVVEVDGGGRRTLINDGDPAYAPAWSPDGSTIAFLRNCYGPSPTEVWAMDADGVNRRRLTTLPQHGCSSIKHVSWASDGSRIRFAYAPTGEAATLWTMNADGSDVVQVIRLPQRFGWLVDDWSADGKLVALTRMGTLSDVYLLNVESGTLTRVTGGNQGSWGAAFVP